MIFSESSNYPIGLDISDLSLRFVQLKRIGDKIRIQALNDIKIEAGIFENGELKDADKAIKAIRETIDKPAYGKVTSKDVVACLPETKTFIKLIEVMKTSENMAEAVKIELEKHVPMSIEEIYYDWQVVEDLPDRQLILIGAAPKNIVSQYTDLLDKAKLSISALEIEPISICRSLLSEEHFKFKGERKKNYGIIDIGKKRSSITIYSKNTILFSFSLPVSGEEITKKISETLKIKIDQAEKAKIICGLDEGRAKGIIKNILYGMIKDLVGKINESIIFYNHHFPNRGPIDEILLCGGGANIKNLNKIIGEYINIKVNVGNIFTNLNEDRDKILKLLSETHALNKDTGIKNMPNQKMTQDKSLSFSTAVGLALRGIFLNKL